MPIKFKLEDVPLNILPCFVLHNWSEKRTMIDEKELQQQIRQNISMQSTTDWRFTYSLTKDRAVGDISTDYFTELTD